MVVGGKNRNQQWGGRWGDIFPSLVCRCWTKARLRLEGVREGMFSLKGTEQDLEDGQETVSGRDLKWWPRSLPSFFIFGSLDKLVYFFFF